MALGNLKLAGKSHGSRRCLDPPLQKLSSTGVHWTLTLDTVMGTTFKFVTPRLGAEKLIQFNFF